ncbi:MAG: HNH endonuclease signature motif containing protein [candidate division WOR-3 bacterium]
MLWHYHCPDCGHPLEVEWARHREETVCRKCRLRHYPPTPDEDPFAYIAGAKWPPELEQIVIAHKGSVCSAPGCFRSYNTLTLKKPISKGGRISVDNLIPVCTHHARDKGEQDYEEWIQNLKERELNEQLAAVPPPMIQAKAPPAESAEAVPLAGYVQLISRESNTRLMPLPENRPVVMAPFLRGAVRRLVFDYEWEAKGGGEVKVYLVAWPRGEEPRLDFLESEEFAGLKAVKEHWAERDARGEGCVTLELPPAPMGRWTAAVVMEGNGAFAIKEFVLAGCD